MKTTSINGLYLITDSNRDGQLLQRVEAALRGGARIVQYRDKTGTAEEQLALAKSLRQICHQGGALFMVNDQPQLARDCGADGVHLGQQDMELDEARRLLGPEAIIGVSTRTAEQALQAEAQGADYIGVGSIYPTGTKEDAKLIGLDTLRQIRQAVALPIVAIGGIDSQGAGAAIDAGANSLAVVSAVMGAPCPTTAAREIALQFNRRRAFPRGRVLSVAGSDSGGGAGIQADLKTISLLGSYGMSAITALTAQNTLGVQGIHPCPSSFVAEQIDAVLSDLGADVLKTGMLFCAEIIAVVAEAIERHGLPAVVDPVMIAKGGASLLQQQAIETLKNQLLPRTYLLTPNLPEAEALTGIQIRQEADMERAARDLHRMGARNVLLKGGHLEGEAVDLLLTADQVHHYRAPRIDTPNTHGTGCTFSAAIATFMAQGLPLTEAVSRGKEFITQAIGNAQPLGTGHGPVNHWQAAKAVTSDRINPVYRTMPHKNS